MTNGRADCNRASSYWQEASKSESDINHEQSLDMDCAGNGTYWQPFELACPVVVLALQIEFEHQDGFGWQGTTAPL
jgi:hypothetical protein